MNIPKEEREQLRNEIEASILSKSELSPAQKLAISKSMWAYVTPTGVISLILGLVVGYLTDALKTIAVQGANVAADLRHSQKREDLFFRFSEEISEFRKQATTELAELTKAAADGNSISRAARLESARAASAASELDRRVEELGNLEDLARKLSSLSTNVVEIAGNIRTNSSFMQIIREAKNEVPAGTVAAYWGTKDPEGWAICDGRPLDEAKYSRLREVLGASESNLPDLRGMFLRGLDPMGKRDPEGAGRSVGGIQGFSTSVEGIKAEGERPYYDRGGAPFTVGSGSWNIGQGTTISLPLVGGGRETRPINTTVSWIMKL